MDRLSKRERQDRILTRLNTTVAVRISDLAEEFDVTTETIRRDLDALAERGPHLWRCGDAGFDR